MALVAAANLRINIALATVAALAFHLVRRNFRQSTARIGSPKNLSNALIINVILAIFNLFPLPPLDGWNGSLWVCCPTRLLFRSHDWSVSGGYSS